LNIFLKLLSDSGIDVNHKNNNNETVFIYCCKKDKPDVASKLIFRCPECDLFCIDNEGRTGLMYLVENGRYIPLSLLSKRDTGIPLSKQIEKINLNYRSKNNETLISILVKQFYKTWQEKNSKAKRKKN